MDILSCIEDKKTTINYLEILKRKIDELVSPIIFNPRALNYSEYVSSLVYYIHSKARTPLIIAKVGDIKDYHNKKSLVCMAGIDVPPYISGKFVANKRVIAKKGNKCLRRNLYLLTNSMMTSRPKTDTAVYGFMCKKKAEHKYNKQVRVAGMRKFLHIYYARVKEVYIELGVWDKQLSKLFLYLQLLSNKKPRLNPGFS